MVGDPISDLIIRIKNAGRVHKEELTMPHSKLKAAVAEAMSKAGFIGKVEKNGKNVKKTLTIELLYKADGAPRIADVKRVSKPGRRLYKGVKHIFPIKYGKGVAIYSTPKGILTDEQARKERVGGEELFKIW
ncbi:MAG: 30S ribosomal protein S8 [Candidatus Pacebacteria bacterium]|nr:30S ribosomal protein S8 [Candidatus Paceibacterota bacterium]